MLRDRDQGPLPTDNRSPYLIMRDVLFNADHYMGRRRELLRSNLPDKGGNFNYGLLIIPGTALDSAHLRLHAILPDSRSENLSEALREIEIETNSSGIFIAREGVVTLERPRLVTEIVKPQTRIQGTDEAMFEIIASTSRREFSPFIPRPIVVK
jgi:hypothetical protein